MSRGLGILQRRVCEALYAADGREPPLRELRLRLGEPDRSNLRRAIRGLLERGIVEEFESAGGLRVKLTYWGYVSAGARPEEVLRPGRRSGSGGGARTKAPGGSATSILPRAAGPWASRRGWSSRRSARTPTLWKKACRSPP
jgi:hypothetical protein